MRRYFIGLLILISVNLQAQEKRLALVIGNADYKVGPLKNPVNDALLIAETFDSLGFDIILDTNIIDKAGFEQTIRKFDTRRKDYDVGFVYYAGHGIQVGSENYMIPTQAQLESENDLRYFGVSVQMIVDILTRNTNQVNVLILDACRNNPFESQWNLTRSYSKGNGLAKMQAPMGSLIAFSTTAGNVAPDGKGENSIYCVSLARNMLKERVSLDQMFRNVRAEVLKATNNEQQTEESTQLTGETFYLMASNYEKIYDQVDSLIDIEDYYTGLELIQSILNESSDEYWALYSKAILYDLLEEYPKAIRAYRNLQKRYPSNSDSFWSEGILQFYNGNYPEASKKFQLCIELDSLDEDFHEMLTLSFIEMEDFERALNSINSGLEIKPSNTGFLNLRHQIHLSDGDTSKAIADIEKIVELDPDNWESILNMADLLSKIDTISSQASSQYQKVINDCNEVYSVLRAINNQAVLYEKKGLIDEAIKGHTYAIENFSDSIGLDVALSYRNRGRLHQKQEDYSSAISDFQRAIEIDSSKSQSYELLADLYVVLGDTITALSLFQKQIDLEPSDVNFVNRSALYFDLGNYDLAIKDARMATDISMQDYTYWNWRGEVIKIYCMYYQEEYEEAISTAKAVLREVEKDEYETEDFHTLLAYCYRALDKNKLAEASYRKSVEISPHEFSINALLDFYWESDDTLSFTRFRDEITKMKITIADLIPVLENIFEIEKYWKLYDEAAKTNRLLLSLDTNSENITNKGFILFMQNQMDSSLTFLTKAISLDSTNTSPLFYRSKVYYSIGDSQKANEDLIKAIAIDPNDPEGYFYLAQYHQAQQNIFRALRNYDLAIAKYDGSYYITDIMGEGIVELYDVYEKRSFLYKELGENELMCEDLKKARELGSTKNFENNCAFD